MSMLGRVIPRALAHHVRSLAIASPLTPSVPNVDLIVNKRATPVTVRNIYCIGRACLVEPLAHPRG
jgi:hypothetical protein